MSARSSRSTPRRPNWSHCSTRTRAGSRSTTSAVKELGGPELPQYGADDLERMIKEQSVDRAIVTSPDYTHASVVARILRAGADVIVEKPLTIDADGTRQIVDAMNESGKSVVVTFNYRYSPRNSAAAAADRRRRDRRRSPVVEFQWVLDTRHGADYFRRWHREKENSGGLLVHKASHHFDLVNWWIAASPVRVFASGGLSFYGADNAADSWPWATTCARHGRRVGERSLVRSTCAADDGQPEAVPGERAVRRVHPRPGRVRSRHHDRGQHGSDRGVRARRAAELLAERPLAVGGLPGLRQRHRGPR